MKIHAQANKHVVNEKGNCHLTMQSVNTTLVNHAKRHIKIIIYTHTHTKIKKITKK